MEIEEATVAPLEGTSSELTNQLAPSPEGEAPTTIGAATESTLEDKNEGEQSFDAVCAGLPGFFNQAKWESILRKHGVTYATTRKITDQRFAKISFKTKAEMDQAITKLNGVQVRDAIIKIKPANPRVRAPPEPEAGSAPDEKKQRREGKEAEVKDINDIVTPMWRLDYEDQIRKKRNRVLKKLKAVQKEIRKRSGYDLPEWIKKSKSQAQCCSFKAFIRAEESDRDGYRNKSTFTVGRDVAGRPCIGFSLGRTENAQTAVADPSSCCNIPKGAKAARNLLQRFIESSPLPPYEKIAHVGFWREVVVRSTQSGEVMLIVQVNDASVSEDTLRETKSNLVDFVKASTEPPIASLYFQPYSGVSNKAPDDLEMELLWGAPYIYETLLGLKFRISPTSFFQVNTAGAEALYRAIGDWVGADENSVLFDICCGTGTIGLSLASRAKQVVGVDIVNSAIMDAQINADINGIHNARFVAGKAEDVLTGLLEEYRDFPSVAVLDPPRAGAHPDVLKAVRMCERLQRLVYVSCNQNVLASDLANLCRSASRSMVGKPFRPVQALAVDMFPHTEHCELVVLLERIDSPTFSPTSEAKASSSTPPPASAPANDQATNNE